MPTKRQNIKLGIFIAAVALLLVTTITFVGGQRFWRDRDVYWVMSRETVAGIGPQSPVTLNGVRVGEVAGVELDDERLGRVWVELSIDPGVQIPAGVYAYFRSSGLTGERMIDLADGAEDEGRLPPGSIIPRASTTFEELESRAKVITANAEELTERASELLASINALVDHVEPERVGRLFDDAEILMESLVSTSRALESAVRETRADVDGVTGKAEEVLEGADEAAAELTELLQHADKVLRRNEDDVRATIRGLRRTTRAAEQLVRQLRRHPSLLLRSEPPEERELP